MKRCLWNLFIVTALVSSLGGCNSTMKEIGVEPALSQPDLSVGTVSAILAQHTYPSVPASTSLPPTVRPTGLFLNKRALAAGDILTVQIAINDKAQLTNKSNRNRTGKKSVGLDGAFDIAGAGTTANLEASLRNATDFSGNGGTSRSESINLSVAAVVTGVLQNGNLVITGSQEVRVNAELRILTITGIVRPTDILPSNTISYERIAEARVSYGGRGRITEMQQPAYGQQFLDRISPL